MQRFWMRGMSLCALLSVAACGGSHDDHQASTTVDELATGVHVVAVGDENAPTVGRYLAAADGSRLLLLMDDNERVTRVYQRPAGGAWRGLPAATEDVTVSFLDSRPLPTQAEADFATLAGAYVTRLPDASVAVFSLGADGTISAGDSACRLSGRSGATALPGTRELELNASGCAGVPANSRGHLIVDPDQQPARLRLVVDAGPQVVDLWGYSD